MSKKKIFLILLLIALALPVGISLSKYLYNFVNDYLMEANNFFFNSDKLGESTKIYNINNWSGVSPFEVQFQLNNHKNNILTSDADIEYNVAVYCDTDVTCSLSSTQGVIYKNELTDDVILTINPQRVFDTDETISVRVEATSTSPYEKTISAVFNATVGKKGISYQIDDSEGLAYLRFTITNALDQYKVFTAFGSYSVGDLLSTNEYKALSASEKNNCASAIITLTFDPNEILIDTTNNIINAAISTVTQNINGVDYISSISFKIDSMSSNAIRFYKIDKTEDHTYPFGEDSVPIITFSADM